jgi:uncharacterized membrane protein
VILLMALAAVAWLALVIAAPALPVPIAGVMYLAGSLICHQLPERSFHLFGAQLPVCARCLGIYAGVAIGLSAHAVGFQIVKTGAASIRRLRVALLAGVAPTVVTVALEWMALWEPSNAVRACAGLALGVPIAFVVIEAAAKLHYEPCVPQRRIAPRPPATPI